MIEVKDLYKEFDGTPVLKGINGVFENGKTSLVIGRSGSGKTVLLKCMLGLLTPEKGDILYDGMSYTEM
ncbi:MAG: ATP-binding cassette domain-containing protein, partial [Flavobacteriaceae bacterium]|nr:ATP-binding cassette domain-containing protein [Flavobacteriaceae bacterium]